MLIQTCWIRRRRGEELFVKVRNIKIQVISNAGSLNIGSTVNILPIGSSQETDRDETVNPPEVQPPITPPAIPPVPPINPTPSIHDCKDVE